MQSELPSNVMVVNRKVRSATSRNMSEMVLAFPATSY
jgi:hypothetical protein